MPHKTLLLALSTLTLAGCSALQSLAQIPPPPVALISRCLQPPALLESATAQDLAEFTVGWIGTAGCERAKRQALIEAWPR